MKKTLILIMLIVLAAARPALSYEIMVVKSADEPPMAQVVRAFSDKLAHLLPARGVKSIEPYRFREIDISQSPIKSAVEQEIRETRPDLILALGRNALLAVRDIPRIPVIYLLVVAPDIIIEDRDNITGVNLDIPARLQFAEISRLLPSVRRIGVIYNTAHSAMDIQQAKKDRPDLEFIALNAQSTKEVPARLEELRGRADLIWLLPDLIVTNPQTLESYFLFSFTNKVPVLAFSEKYLKSGAAVAVTFDLEAMGEQAAGMAARLLLGAPVSTVPPMDISRVKTIVNPTAARKLQLPITEETPR
ncbi:MAG: ABC transporter substrate binding protein [Thermodesulfobacteriota bacterium]